MQGSRMQMEKLNKYLKRRNVCNKVGCNKENHKLNSAMIKSFFIL